MKQNQYFSLGFCLQALSTPWGDTHLVLSHFTKPGKQTVKTYFFTVSSILPVKIPYVLPSSIPSLQWTIPSFQSVCRDTHVPSAHWICPCLQVPGILFLKVFWASVIASEQGGMVENGGISDVDFGVVDVEVSVEVLVDVFVGVDVVTVVLGVVDEKQTINRKINKLKRA